MKGYDVTEIDLWCDEMVLANNALSIKLPKSFKLPTSKKLLNEAKEYIKGLIDEYTYAATSPKETIITSEGEKLIDSIYPRHPLIYKRLASALSELIKKATVIQTEVKKAKYITFSSDRKLLQSVLVNKISPETKHSLLQLMKAKEAVLYYNGYVYLLSTEKQFLFSKTKLILEEVNVIRYKVDSLAFLLLIKSMQGLKTFLETKKQVKHIPPALPLNESLSILLL